MLCSTTPPGSRSHSPFGEAGSRSLGDCVYRSDAVHTVRVALMALEGMVLSKRSITNVISLIQQLQAAKAPNGACDLAGKEELSDIFNAD